MPRLDSHSKMMVKEIKPILEVYWEHFSGKGSVWKRKQTIRKPSQRVKIHLEGKPNRPKN